MNATPEELRKRHDDLVNFLRENTALGEPNIHENVLMINRAAIHIGQGSRIDSFVKLEGGQGLRIGRYVHVASFAHLGIGGGETLVEDFAAIASGGKLISGSNQVDARTMSACAPGYMQRVARSFVVIARYACVLTNAVVLPGVTLHEGAVLAAGAVATQDIPPWEIWGGVPAKFIANREIVEAP